MKNALKKRGVQTTLWVILILLLWETASRSGMVSQYLLPPFSSVCGNLLQELSAGVLAVQVLNSLLVVLEGMGISFLAAILLTVLCTWSEAIESLCNALCTIFNPLPGMAILPLVMIWFGVNSGAMIFLIVHGVLWPLLMNLLAGFRSTPAIYRDFAKNIGLSPLKMVFDILIFSVMPYFISGLRIGWGRAWRALISAEMVFGMIGTLGGLGFYIYTNRAYGNITNVLSGVLIIVIIGMLVEQLFKALEKCTVNKWGMSNG